MSVFETAITDFLSSPLLLYLATCLKTDWLNECIYNQGANPAARANYHISWLNHGF